MFVQIIQGGLAADRAELKEALDRWERELESSAEGWLGTTAGVTDDGTFIGIVRFASVEAARRNSERPEQHRWWTETSKLFRGEVTFHDCTDVDLMMDGGSDDAGFVQVIQGRIRDLEGLRAYLRDMDEQALRGFRPDIIGSITAYHADGGFTEAAYFTSEAEAREGERSQPPQEMRDEMDKMMAFYEGEWTYLDLREPWLSSP
ncbi:hypothetical protein [Spirillospora sp. NBC_01491]|uniref:hypothetical protein n=1 Tax=Spirillospora sp. NBC_01491 TaxID=2976007 RepID=UPI002E2F6049|nr:hypothetical protein [Spirillospora sp. NBC_01491]